MPVVKEQTKKVVQTVVLDYGANATFHGIQYVFSPNTSSRRRSVAWTYMYIDKTMLTYIIYNQKV